MLVLTRRKDELVILTLPTDPAELLKLAGARIGVMLIEIRRDQVRLGFEAPKEIVIVRKELMGEKP